MCISIFITAPVVDRMITTMAKFLSKRTSYNEIVKEIGNNSTHPFKCMFLL